MLFNRTEARYEHIVAKVLLTGYTFGEDKIWFDIIGSDTGEVLIEKGKVIDTGDLYSISETTDAMWLWIGDRRLDKDYDTFMCKFDKQVKVQPVSISGDLCDCGNPIEVVEDENQVLFEGCRNCDIGMEV